MPDEATIRRLLRKGTIDRKFVPLMCGTAFKNKGVQPLLDAVVSYLPSPLDIQDVQGAGRVGLSVRAFVYLSLGGVCLDGMGPTTGP